jgi:hypothetical protein
MDIDLMKDARWAYVVTLLYRDCDLPPPKEFIIDAMEGSAVPRDRISLEEYQRLTAEIERECGRGLVVGDNDFDCKVLADYVYGTHSLIFW